MTHHLSFSVPLPNDRSYPIYFASKNLNSIGATCQAHSIKNKIGVITNPTIAALYESTVTRSLKEAGYDVLVITVPDGESAKNMAECERIINTLLDHRFERNDTLLALGGGVIGDLTGFVASIYLRGIRFAQIPTTLLAQVDASIGGKTGINNTKGKNLIGTFYQPEFVFIDSSTLSTLPENQVRSGLAEVIKYGVIHKSSLFDDLRKNLSTLQPCQVSPNATEIWDTIIRQGCEIKAAIVGADERESGIREILNYGHTIGHAIETITSYTGFLHGEAIAVGMIAANHIAREMELLSDNECHTINTLISEYGYTLTLSENTSPIDQIMDCLTLDKKVRNGKLRFVLPSSIGTVKICDDISKDLIANVLKTHIIK